ncbi:MULTISPECIES: DUF3046 domain-containing protein [unclassified Janibacter]|uniref:DUF3046 domain-containing protein n=1 Tax=unclassified Janibacter TaxID=2649294 RepID=UPI003D07D0F5
MRISTYWELMDDEFGTGYARSLSRDHVLSALGERTPDEALAAGVAPRDVWRALCIDMDVPESRRFGRELREPKPR